MKKYTEPEMSLLILEEDDILTTSALQATKVTDTTTAEASVSLKMSDIVSLN